MNNRSKLAIKMDDPTDWSLARQVCRSLGINYKAMMTSSGAELRLPNHRARAMFRAVWSKFKHEHALLDKPTDQLERAVVLEQRCARRYQSQAYQSL